MTELSRTGLDAYRQMQRAATLAGRPGVLVLDQDIRQIADSIGSRARVHEALRQLERHGVAEPIRRGVYVLTDQHGSIRMSALELIGAVSPTNHLVTAGAALEYHELTTQHFRRIFVLVHQGRRPWEWRGIEVNYRSGVKFASRDSIENRSRMTRIASAERAVFDSLVRPRWGVPLSEVQTVIEVAMDRDSRFIEKLATVVATYGSHASARRFGYLIEEIAGRQVAGIFAPLIGSRAGATPLRAGGGSNGDINGYWRIRDNRSSRT